MNDPADGSSERSLELARRIDALERELSEERDARRAMETAIARQNAQILDLSRAVRSILSSRIWRTLQYTGGGLLSAQARIWQAVRSCGSILRKSQPRVAASQDLPSATPRISVLMPVFDTPEKWLRASIESVLAQTHPNWELCVADDGSTAPHVRSVLSEYAARDRRVRLVFRAVNGGIAAASNSCLDLAAGEFIALLDHDDELHHDAIREATAVLNRCPDADMLYSDEDKIDERGFHLDPFFKPDWSPDYLLGCMYTGHLSVYRTQLVREIGGFRPGVDGAQDYDLALRVGSRTDRIHHIAAVLYHWRTLAVSMACGVGGQGLRLWRRRIRVAELS